MNLPICLSVCRFEVAFAMSLYLVKSLKKINRLRWACAVSVILMDCLFVACNKVDDDRIPSLPVNINLGDAGLWNRYGVHGFGIYKYFIPLLGEPQGFNYTVSTAAGYGGVLLIGGMDPYNVNTEAVLAYDLACPIECKPDIRIAIDNTTFEAICPECGSHYDVTMGGGVPVSGVASEGKHRSSLRRYRALATQYGGYLITN